MSPLTIFLSLLLATCAFSLQFFLESKSRKCFREDIPLHTDATLTYTVAQGDGEMPISLRVTTAAGSVVHQKDSIDHGVFSFRSPDRIPGVAERDSWALKDDDRDEDDDAYWSKAGPDAAGDDRVSYRFCFAHAGSGISLRGKTVKRRVIFDVKAGSDARTMEYYDKLAKEKHLSSTEELFRVVEDRVSDIVRLIDEMRQRELRLDHMSTKTNRIVAWYSALACGAIAAGAALSSYVTFKTLHREKVI